MRHLATLVLALSLASCKPPTTTPTTPGPPPAVLTPSAPAVPKTGISGKVVGCHDGDSLTLLTAGNVEIKIRLEGIDAPELGQSFGKAAKEALSSLAFGKVATIKPMDKPDRYGRTLSRVFVGAVDVNRDMILQGMAWHFTTYSKEAALASAERVARAAKRGLWADAAPVPPWDFRRLEKEKQDAKRAAKP